MFVTIERQIEALLLFFESNKVNYMYIFGLFRQLPRVGILIIYLKF